MAVAQTNDSPIERTRSNFCALVLVSDNYLTKGQKQFKITKDQKEHLVTYSPTLFRASQSSNSIPTFPQHPVEHLAVELKTSSCASPLTALVNSGATDSFIDKAFARTNNLLLVTLKTGKLLFLFDGNPSAGGRIDKKVDLEFALPGFTLRKHPFLVTPLPPTLPLVLGHDFLNKHNPGIDWQAQTIAPRAPTRAPPLPPPTAHDGTAISRTELVQD